MTGTEGSGAPALGATETSELLLSTSAEGGSAAAGTVVGVSGSVPTHTGARLAFARHPVHGIGTQGSLGHPALDAVAVEQLTAALDDSRARDGIRVLEVTGGQVELYVEVRRAIRELIVVGAGHVAQPMAHMGAMLGYRVTVLDDRPDFATRERFPDADRLIRADFSDPFADVTLHERSFLLLVTRGHKYDYECLIRALRADPGPAYIGMIGSRRRVRATYVQLLDDGVDRALLERIHAPVGLDIGAETPEEIAVSVAAELVMLDRGGTGVPLKGLERVAERFFKDAESDP
jgi:xanthine dehydrogenase accessory factor